MARYDAESSIESPSIVRIVGKEVKDGEGYTVYVIQVSLERYSWTLRRRYSEFLELDKQLAKRWNMDGCVLPPKKLLGRQQDAFLQKRMKELEIYLQAVLRLHPKVPPPLASFLDFPVYEIHGIVQKLSRELFFRGEAALESREPYIFSPLHLHAVSERLKLPEPPCDSDDSCQDLSHVLDFVSQLERAHIVGRETPLSTSNIVPNHLGFDLLRFRNLKHLKIVGYPPSKISGLEMVRKTLETLEIRSSISAVKEMLLCDLIHSETAEDMSPALRWPKLERADFGYNALTAIDGSIRLLCRVKELDLSHNKIGRIENLELMPALRHLDLSFNCLGSPDALHTRLGNVVTLNLADNHIVRLAGFARLYSLVTLDLTSNEVAHVGEVAHLSKLPCLENLTLVANPVTLSVDYRTRILELFESRAAELCLDNESATAKEIGTVAVRLALKRGREAAAAVDLSLTAAMEHHHRDSGQALVSTASSGLAVAEAADDAEVTVRRALAKLAVWSSVDYACF